MKTITVAELRQNPTEALTEVSQGETFVVTRHRREIARLVPPSPAAEVVPPRRPGPSQLQARPRRSVRTAESVDALLDEMKSEQ